MKGRISARGTAISNGVSLSLSLPVNWKQRNRTLFTFAFLGRLESVIRIYQLLPITGKYSIAVPSEMVSA